jgi:thymidine phosphorylase
MHDVCAHVGVATRFVFSRMDRPLGRAVGNFCEAIEAKAALHDVRAASPDLVEITEVLAQAMVMTAFPDITPEDALARVREVWSSGKAYAIFVDMIRAHNGNWTATHSQWQRTPSITLYAEADGFLADLDARAVADVGMTAGVGRMRESDNVDPCAGIVFHASCGQAVRAGDVLAVVYSSDARRCEAAAAQLRPLLQTTTAPVEPEPSIILGVW